MAALKGCFVLLSQNIEPSVALLPEGVDPDEMALRSRNKLSEILSAPINLFKFLELCAARYFGGMRSPEFLEALSQNLRGLTTSPLLEMALNDLGEKMGLETKTLQSFLSSRDLGSKSNIVKFFYGTSNTTNIFGYLALGAAYWNYVEILWGVIFTLRRYMRIGQFEEIFLTPVSGLEYILSWSVFGISRVTIESVPILILALLSNLLTIKPLNLLLFICSFVISIIASFGFVFLFFGLTLLLKDADELVSLVGNAAPLIGGMFFPVTVLPKFLRYVSYVFPFTWGLDLSRHFLMGTKTIF